MQNSRILWLAKLLPLLFATIVSANEASVRNIAAASSQCEQMYELPAGWSMLSLACEVEDPSLEALFPTAISLFEFVESSGYQAATSLEPGKGYWINMPAPATVLLTGVPLSSCAVNFSAGWSMIGSCSAAPSVADLQVATSGKLISVFGFDAGYRSANILEPGRGYWVNMTAAGVLNFGGEWSQDCNGVWGGDAVVDNCGTCDADPSNDCVEDCSGEWGGTHWMSDCGCVAAANSGDDCDDCAGIWDTDTCIPCEAEAYNHDDDPHTPCITCSAPCSIGVDEAVACTSTSDRVCGGCGDGFFASGAGCQQCDTCVQGETQTASCGGSSNTQCSACDFGTWDHDADPLTECIQCTSCGSDKIAFGICSPTSDISCETCGTNPANIETVIIDPEKTTRDECPELDPNCLETIDVLVLYTPAFINDFYQGDEEQMAELIHYWFYLANEANTNSFLTPAERYRIAGIIPFPYEERENIESDLIWLKHNPYYQSLRKSKGADVGLFILGTAKYGGYAYASGIGSYYDDFGVVAVEGAFMTDSFDWSTVGVANNCGNQFTAAHELGHILGANHLASFYANIENSTSSVSAYHNQEINYRRTAAFNLPVSQHDLKFYSVMSYSDYKDSEDRTQACPECVQLPFFASPDLWWFFNPTDPLYGYCMFIEENSNGTINMICEGEEIWAIGDELWSWQLQKYKRSYVINQEKIVTLDPQEIVDRAVPLGVDNPSYNDPNSGETVQLMFQTRNRDAVLNSWWDKANNASPLAPASECTYDCGQMNRANCAIDSSDCGVCLPGYIEVDNSCLGRLEIDKTNPLHDERYENSGIYVHAPGDNIEINIDLARVSSIYQIEIYLGTVDDSGQTHFDWADVGHTTWLANPAPKHRFEIYGMRTNGEEFLVAESDGTNNVLKESGGEQNNHTLSYLFSLSTVERNISAIKIILGVDAANTSSYGMSLNEVRIFGTAAE